MSVWVVIQRLLELRAVPFPKLLDLVAALDGGLGGGRGEVGGSVGDGGGNLIPVGGAEVAAVEGVPFFLVGVDEGYRFVVGPTRRRETAADRHRVVGGLCGESSNRRRGGDSGDKSGHEA